MIDRERAMIFKKNFPPSESEPSPSYDKQRLLRVKT